MVHAKVLITLLLVKLISGQEENEVNQNEIEQTVKPLKLTSFGWSDCGSTGGVIKSVSVGPDPILVPGNVTVGYSFSAFQNLTSPSPFHMRIQKKVTFFWIDIPCENNQGSCDYDDFCTRWPLPNPCPAAYSANGIPCTCPFIKGDYNLPPSYVGKINSLGPAWLSDGDFKLKSWIEDRDTGAVLACLQLELSLKSV